MEAKELDDDIRTMETMSQSESPRSLAGPIEEINFGEQLSSFTELKQGKRPGILFNTGTNSPLKTDDD